MTVVFYFLELCSFHAYLFSFTKYLTATICTTTECYSAVWNLTLVGWINHYVILLFSVMLLPKYYSMCQSEYRQCIKHILILSSSSQNTGRSLKHLTYWHCHNVTISMWRLLVKFIIIDVIKKMLKIDIKAALLITHKDKYNLAFQIM